MINKANLQHVKLNSGFLFERAEVNRKVTLKTEYEQLLNTGRLYSMKMTWKEGMPDKPHFFWDSDVAKWIEACAYSLASSPDKELESKVDEIIDIMEKSQQKDGYLNSYYQTVEVGKRFSNLKDKHELYCAGHLIEAAVAYYETTGKDQFLNIMKRYADLLCSIFGNEEGKLKGYPGHEEIELALVKLFDVTKDKKYLDLSEFFVLERGKSPNYYDIEREKADPSIQFYDYHIPALKKHAYIQAHEPVLSQQKVEGHAVRALYYLSGVADIAYRTNNTDLITACKRLYDNVVNQRMYITGGVGSSLKIENFSFDYDLPNELAYAETCASIALAFFVHRMFLYEKNGKYMDIFEKALYNGILSGMSLDGTEFFYSNPLEVNKQAVDYDTLGLKSNMGYKRKKWFGCACCPPNIARLLSSLGQYMYATSEDTVFVNLYAGSTLTFGDVLIEQHTSYPFDENIVLRIKTAVEKTFTLALRIPSWCEHYTVRLDHKKLNYEVKDGYLYIERAFLNDDEIHLTLDMPVNTIQSHPSVRQNVNKLAIQRGPVIYCLEHIDNKVNLNHLYLSKDTKFKVIYDQLFLGGCAYIEGVVHKIKSDESLSPLYSVSGKAAYEDFKITAVPYCLWTNRYPGDMVIWMNKLCKD
ncbi:MAG: glycoside hydrolase family 127 protein [Clostridia bacterium]|nr:glycoside hydrolase family 127 protein [Clostridia bacterium]